MSDTMRAVEAIARGSAKIDIFIRRQRSFVLWLPMEGAPAAKPMLVIGTFQPGNPPTLASMKRFDLIEVPGKPGLWELPAANCSLTDGQVYHYWFRVADTRPGHAQGDLIHCSDPLAYSVDWRLMPPEQFAAPDDRQPAAVIKFQDGKLIPCTPGGETENYDGDVNAGQLPPNNKLVIYELPTAWARSKGYHEYQRGVGTFQDVMALVSHDAGGANFDNLEATQLNQAYLKDLGINALELLPPADSVQDREWGYGTSHYLAPDYELGFPEGNSWPTCITDLSRLVVACHRAGMRIFMDAVMGFSRCEAYQYADFDAFYRTTPDKDETSPDARTSIRGGGSTEPRQDFGGRLFRYEHQVRCYDPITGEVKDLHPARCLMQLFLARWIYDYRFDGVRVDSVETVANWDFLREFTASGRALMRKRCEEVGVYDADPKFITVGEELTMPTALIDRQKNWLDGMWNEKFRQYVRAAILGESADGLTFEQMMRKLTDCRQFSTADGRGFTNGAQAINYITSHDTQGYRQERLFNMLQRCGMSDEQIARHARLAYACLLTSVGIPMILAGEEFLDEHDLFASDGRITHEGGKQVDPVNYGRLEGGDTRCKMRREVKDYIARLIKLRTSHPALAVDETNIIHYDFEEGKRVIAWMRGSPRDPVVVVANFSDWGTAPGPSAEYRVKNWPATPQGKRWREVTQSRPPVPQDWAGREPIYPWEAKVYVLEDIA